MATPVRVICDSTADLEPGYRQAHGILVVPLKVIFGEEVLSDGVDIEPEAFYERMRSEPQVAPRTSQPTPAEFEAAFREASADGSTVVCTTISAELSGSMASAAAAREALPERSIHLVDSRTAGLGHNALLREAVAAAEAGASAEAVLGAIEQVQQTQRLVFTVESLEHLRRGGRIGGARALVGSLLSIKPVLHVEHGRVEALDRVRTLQRAVDRLLQELASASAAWSGRARVTIGHAARAEPAAALADRAGAHSAEPPLVIPVGPVIGCHTGPGALGLAFHRIP